MSLFMRTIFNRKTNPTATTTKNPRHNLTLLTFLAMLQNFATAKQKRKSYKRTSLLSLSDAHTRRPAWPVMSAGPSMIHLGCSGTCTCQHGVQSWSSHSGGQEERTWGTAEKGQEEWGVGGTHRTDHLFFMDFSISVTVHGWEAGGKRSPVCPVCQRLARPTVPSALATFSPPPRVWFRFTSGLPQLIMNKPPSGASLKVVWSTWQPCVF